MKKFLCMIALFCFLLSACSNNDAKQTESVSLPENDDQKYGGTIELACVPYDTLNPLINKHASVSDMLCLVYEGLFECMPDQSVEPVLASGWKSSQNNTEYTITLKENIKFHDGSTLDAEDVVATLDYIFLYGQQYDTLKDNILLYHSSSKYTVNIVLKRPVSDFACCLDFPILPSGLLADDFALENNSFRPVGTGMYKYEKIEAFKNICLKSNSMWHGDKKPYIENVNVHILSDADTIIASFDAGVIDVCTTSWKTPADMNLTSSIYNSYKTEQNRFTYIGINCACADFDTVEERQYLRDSVDAKRLADDIMSDSASVAYAPLRENVYFNQNKISEQNHSDEGSTTKIIDNEENGDVILLYNSDSKTKERLAYALKYQLENKGFMVKLDSQNFADYTSKVLVGAYDIYIGEVNIDNSGNLEFMFGETRNGQNICTYKSEELLSHITNLNRATTRDARSAMWTNFKKYYTETVFQIPLYFTDGCSYVNKKIMGELTPNLSNLLSGFENLYTEKTEV